MTEPSVDDLPTVFMLVEIKVRELRAKLHLASQLAVRGFRVYVGSRQAIMESMTARPHRTGVYFLKSGEAFEALKKARFHTEFVVGQDEEIGPALSAGEVERAWRTRFPSAVVALIDRLFVYSTSHRDILCDVNPSLAARATVTGWPRADLWSAELRGDDTQMAEQLRRRHGPFVLLVSNFKVNTETQRQRSIDAARHRYACLSDTDRVGVEADPDHASNASRRLASFQRTVELLHEIAQQPHPPIIVRPHPAESPHEWKRALAGLDGIRVIYQGEVGPWLLAADAMIHTGCTTAVQAAFYDIPCGYLAQIGFPAGDYRRSAPYLVSTPLEDLGAIRHFLKAAAGTDGIDRPRAEGETALESVLGPRDGRAAARIADEIERLDVRAEPAVPGTRWVPLRRAIAVTAGRVRRSRVVSRGRIRFVGTNAQAKIPGGIHAPEARRLLAGMPAARNVTVSEPRFDLVCIEPSLRDR